MEINLKEIKNPKYIIFSRIAFWVSIFILLPLFFIRISEGELNFADCLTFFVYVYIIIGNYVLGYRLFNPPYWVKWVVPSKWISEWKFLSNADAETIQIKRNHKNLIRITAGAALIMIFLLALLSGKI